MKIVWIILGYLIFLQTPVFAGSEAKLFVPQNYAPLSSFIEKSTTTSETMNFTVSPQILNYITVNQYSSWVAFQNTSGVVSLLTPTSIQAATGKVTLTTTQKGKFVFVSSPFINDYPIVTHWKQSLNGGHGGFQAGAADGIGVLDYFPEFNVVGETTDIFDQNPNSPYTFNVAKYALFSSDPIEPNAKVPTVDRYVGENYAVDKITDRLAVYQSLKAVETTGFPLIHRNHPWAFNSSITMTKRVIQNLPAFQIVHAMVVEAEVGKSSLATFILPPGWVSRPTKAYPIMFNGMYDIHQNFSWGSGQDFIQIIADLLKSGMGSSVGILWNGGGAYGPQTMQLSAYLNAAYLFELAKYYTGADPQKVVTAGISRGAQTALNVAANPIFSNYKVSYALAWAPPVTLGEHSQTWASSNYPGDFVNGSWSTGYKYAYQSGFIDPITGLDGRKLFMQSVSGYADQYFTDALSPLGDWLIASLKAKGTSVYMSVGTHDSFIPLNHGLRLHQKIKDFGIPVGFDLGHRLGHAYFTDRRQIIFNAMKEMISGTLKPFSGVRHFRQTTEPGLLAEEFTPNKTFIAELPQQLYRGEKMRVDIAGSAGMLYSVFYFKINDAIWNNQKQIQTIGEAITLQSGVFSGSAEIQSQPYDIVVPTDMPIGKYICLAAISVDNGATWSLVDMTKNPNPKDNGLTLIEVIPQEQTEMGPKLGSDLTYKGALGSGISTH